MNKNILIWSLLTIIISCSGSLADEPKGEPDYGTGNNPPLTFAVISDIHFGN